MSKETNRDEMAGAAEKRCEDILREAVCHYGNALQVLKAIEELGELIRAIARIWMCGDDEDKTVKAYANLAEEMADVEIMLEQLKIIYGNSKKVAIRREIKLGRLSARMREEQKTEE